MDVGKATRPGATDGIVESHPGPVKERKGGVFGWLGRVATSLGAAFQGIFRTCPDPPDIPAEDERPPFLIVGHRGSAGRRPENTIPSFELALHSGANGVEADLCMTADGHVVVWHDWDPETPVALLRQRGWEPYQKYRPLIPKSGPYRKRVSQLTLDELRAHCGYRGRRGFIRKARARIPVLEELLEMASRADGCRFIHLDIKIPPDEAEIAPRMAASIARSLDAARPGCDIVLNTPHESVLQGLRSGAPHLEYTHDLEMPFGLVTEPGAHSAVQRAIAIQSRWASTGRPTILTVAPWSTFSKGVASDMVLRAHHNSRPEAKRVEHLMAWTINTSREMACLLRLGVTGIVTDRPRRLRAIGRRLGRVR